MAYLLDTNALSEPAKPRPEPRFLKRFKKARQSIAMPAPVWNELLYGCYRLPRSRRRTELESYVRDVLGPTVPVLPYDAIAAEWHATEGARLGMQGKTPAYVDGQIAAVAVTRRLILVTRNVQRFEEFEDLTIENWMV